MAKIRTLPDKFYDKDYENNGIHRVPLWRIGCFALNNTGTNLYMFMLMYLSYYLMGFVVVGHGRGVQLLDGHAYLGRCYRPVRRLHG